MARVKTFANGGSILPADWNSIQDDYETAFSAYKRVFLRGGGATGVLAGGQLLVHPLQPLPVLAGTAVEYLDPADYAVAPRTAKFRLRVYFMVNGTAPVSNFTIGLYPVLTFSAAAAAQPSVATVDVVVPGSTVTFNTPASNSLTPLAGADFSLPAAGDYVVGVLPSANTAANSAFGALIELQTRQT